MQILPGIFGDFVGRLLRGKVLDLAIPVLGSRSLGFHECDVLREICPGEHYSSLCS